VCVCVCVCVCVWCVWCVWCVCGVCGVCGVCVCAFRLKNLEPCHRFSRIRHERHNVEGDSNVIYYLMSYNVL